MEAIIDGVTVMGSPEEINRLIEMRKKPESNLDECAKPIENRPSFTVSSVYLSC